nr:HlyD family efflux transporter periplasmic adaptor subunit [uncultured Cohaesibacter sp.]
MRSIRKRPRSDSLENQKRRFSISLGRYVYLFLLAVFVLSVLNFLYGDMLLLKGDGLILRDRTVVAAGYISRVNDVVVKEGQSVKKGDVIVRIESPDLLERLADLSMRQIDLAQKAAEFNLRLKIANQLLPLAHQRELQASNLVKLADDLKGKGNLTAARYEEVLRYSFDASSDLVKLSVDRDTLSKQLKGLESASVDAKLAIDKLKNHYSDGVIRAPVSGAVGSIVPLLGAVYRAGEPILTIHSGDAYVLTYLPRRYLFPIEAGMEVTIASGRNSVTGVIDSILPVSDTLPKEFQNSFKPSERSQLAKIKLGPDVPFPVYEKVRISRRYALWPWD